MEKPGKKNLLGFVFPLNNNTKNRTPASRRNELFIIVLEIEKPREKTA
jgi:hypothetical protein